MSADEPQRKSDQLAPDAGLEELRNAAQDCRDCPIGKHATQVVFGEGVLAARLMLVGEQPGDREDIQGHPFVGPSGHLLDRALEQLGWARESIFLTNAVKHFKFQLRGKRRMHKSPAQREIEICAQWLDRELALLRPEAAVALGATAARALTGHPVAVMRERGNWLETPDGLPVLVTLHPSALLRGPSAEREQAFERWLDDLKKASAYVEK
ncbi:hydroxyacid dehydrogenase [Pollutimonas subterranea]|uniref:Type-4 uracil-DNA glycosylase n=1 Tax=Pollutimonas subterranea TaxID=2045210 RepID=A0A2N4U6N2_9BURK|nr:UdgX family uracil-DNA binding protein [Pollutimonas subterranea]PLC50657.1 hydroxyacid dehydrogenase [Pollutimonas subterranea]